MDYNHRRAQHTQHTPHLQHVWESKTNFNKQDHILPKHYPIIKISHNLQGNSEVIECFWCVLCPKVCTNPETQASKYVLQVLHYSALHCNVESAADYLPFLTSSNSHSEIWKTRWQPQAHSVLPVVLPKMQGQMHRLQSWQPHQHPLHETHKSNRNKENGPLFVLIQAGFAT